MKRPYRINTITTLADESSGAMLLPHCARADKKVSGALRNKYEK